MIKSTKGKSKTINTICPECKHHRKFIISLETKIDFDEVDPE